MCRENEPIKEMLTTAENRNNLATIKAANGERGKENILIDYTWDLNQ